jgi:hypothetical protein
VILALAFYPQFGLRRSEPTVKSTLRAVAQAGANPYTTTASR